MSRWFLALCLTASACAPHPGRSTVSLRRCSSAVLGSDGLFHCAGGGVYDAGCTSVTRGADGVWHCVSF